MVYNNLFYRKSKYGTYMHIHVIKKKLLSVFISTTDFCTYSGKNNNMIPYVVFF